jgi:hypothetical protein
MHNLHASNLGYQFFIFILQWPDYTFEQKQIINLLLGHLWQPANRTPNRTVIRTQNCTCRRPLSGVDRRPKILLDIMFHVPACSIFFLLVVLVLWARDSAQTA